MTQTLFVPTVNDDISDFCKLFKLYNSAITADSSIELDFSRCSFLRPNAVAFLGGFARTMESGSRSIEFNWDTLRDNVQANLAQNGFLKHVGIGIDPWRGNSIPYREDKLLNKNAIVDYLKTKWLGRGWINVSPLLADNIAGNLVEIYLNAFEHSKSKNGVFTCGQRYPELEQLTISVVDFGVGIPQNVRDFLTRNEPGSKIKSDFALKWAFQSGTTTVDGMGRGIGLDLLKQFVKTNNGSLILFSHDAYVIVDKNSERYLSHECNFHGTIMHITLQCDETLYVLPEELDQKLF
jgi:hypothetical protein